MKQAHGFSVGLWLGVAAMAGGCSSPQMGRIDQNRDIYEQWPLETRQAVLDGKVELGMTPEMVEVSWGKPSEVVTQSKTGDEIWVYKRGGSPGEVYYPGGGPQYPASMGGPVGGGIYGSPGIGISTGRGGTSIGGTGGIGIGGGGMGGTVMGPGSGTAIVTPPTPPDIREVVFRNGVVAKADPPFEK